MALKKINRFLGRYAKGMQFFTSSPYITRISSKMAQVPPGWSKYVFLSFFFHVAEVLKSLRRANVLNDVTAALFSFFFSQLPATKKTPKTV